MAALGGAGGAAAQTNGPQSVDRHAGQSRRLDPLPAGERALLGRIFHALSARAPAIARPILARGVQEGRISQREENRFLARLASVGTRPGGGRAHTEQPETALTPAAREVFRQALSAIRAELAGIAEPMVRAAVIEGAITDAQATRLRGRLSQGPRLGFGLVMRNARAAGATRLP